jgi:hypothetical protein
MTGQPSNAVSRHHIPPPLVYTPAPPKPKETRRRRGIRGAAAADDVDEVVETGEAAPATPMRNAAPLPLAVPVEAAERKTPSTTGNLSADTLKALLTAQEQECGQGTEPAAPKA